MMGDYEIIIGPITDHELSSEDRVEMLADAGWKDIRVVEYQKEMWKVPKDDIYLAIEALKLAIAYMPHVQSDVPRFQAMIDQDIATMRKALETLRTLKCDTPQATQKVKQKESSSSKETDSMKLLLNTIYVMPDRSVYSDCRSVSEACIGSRVMWAKKEGPLEAYGHGTLAAYGPKVCIVQWSNLDGDIVNQIVATNYLVIAEG